MIRFSKGYGLIAAFLFLTECLIAVYVHDQVIRPYIGDVLAVIFLYCLIRAFFTFSRTAVALGVLLFAFALETAQYFSVVDRIGLGHSRMARIVFGTSFSWIDILTYVAGIIIVSAVEYYRGRSRPRI